MKRKVKFCGIKTVADFRSAMQFPITHIGFIFVPQSPRYVLPKTVQHLLTETRRDQQYVGVVQNETLKRVEALINQLPLHIIQLHGEESPLYCEQVREMKIKVWKALSVSELDQLGDYAPYVDGILLDTKTEFHFGGTGKPFDWSQIPIWYEQTVRKKIELWVAGGITSENVKLLQAYPFDGFDVSSGIETDGEKDPQKMKSLVEAI